MSYIPSRLKIAPASPCLQDSISLIIHSFSLTLKKRLRRLDDTSLEPISLTALFILDLGTLFPCLALLFRGITPQLYCLKLH